MSPIHFDLKPIVSVVVCTYNRASYLQACIDSVVHQTFPHWELIIVDDGSRDATFELVDAYLEKFQQIRYLKHRNRKAGYARNAGIQASFGQYITFLDSDDTYKPDHLESRLAFLEANPDIDLVEGGCEIGEAFWVPDYFQPGKLINIKECVLGATFFGKRKVFFELQGFNNLPYGEDTDFWQRAEQRFQTHKLKQPETYVYTRAETSTTKVFLEQMAETQD